MIPFVSFTQRLFPFGGEYRNKITYGEQFPQAPISPIIPSTLPDSNVMILIWEL